MYVFDMHITVVVTLDMYVYIYFDSHEASEHSFLSFTFALLLQQDRSLNWPF